MRLAKPLLAEFLGTFALIFIGAGAATILAPTETVAVALAHGFVIMTFAYAFGNDSGSYINPALSVAVVVAGEHKVMDGLIVAVVQLAGGVAGGLLLAAIYGPNAPNHLGATLVHFDKITLMGAFLLEFVGTFFLANAVLNTAVRGTAGQFAPFAIGMTVSFCIMAFGPVTGASLNPARTLGPAVASGQYADIWMYFLAQILGATAAGLLFRFVWQDDSAEAPAASSELPTDPAGQPKRA